MDLASKIGLQDPFYPKSAIVTAFEEIEQRICCIEENCCDEETGGGILSTNLSTPDLTQIWSKTVTTQPVGSNNIIIGNDSLQGVTGVGNVVLGSNAMDIAANPASITNAYNTLIGQDTGRTLEGEQNTFVGWGVGEGTTASAMDKNIAMGINALHRAGTVARTISNNIAIGVSAMENLGNIIVSPSYPTDFNIAIGTEVMKGLDLGGEHNIAIGNEILQTGGTLLEGNPAILIGKDILSSGGSVGLQGGLIAMGSSCVPDLLNVSGTGAIIMGDKALQAATAVNDTIAIGSNINRGVVTQSGENVLIGHEVLTQATGGQAGERSVMVGHHVGSGGNLGPVAFQASVMIGFNVANNNTAATTGVTDSVLIGASIDSPTTGTTGVAGESYYTSINDSFRARGKAGPGGPTPADEAQTYQKVPQSEPADIDFQPGDLTFYATGTDPTFTLIAKYKDPISGNTRQGTVGTLT